MTGGHRLTVPPDLLAQPSRHSCLRIREVDPLGANTTASTPDAPLRIDERHAMRGPGHIVPRAIPRRSHATRASARTRCRRTGVRPVARSDREPAICRLAVVFRCHDPKFQQSDNPRNNRVAIPLVVPCW